MATVTYYLQNATASYAPATKRGAWDDASTAQTRGMGDKSGTSGASGKGCVSTATDYDWLVVRLVSAPLTANMFFSGAVDGVIGCYEADAGVNAHLHLHLFVLEGQTDTLRGTLWTDFVDPDEAALTDARGEGFSGTLTDVQAYIGDTIVLEAGFRTNSVSSVGYTMAVSCGTTHATDLSDGADSGIYPGWIRLAYTTAPSGHPYYYNLTYN